MFSHAPCMRMRYLGRVAATKRMMIAAKPNVCYALVLIITAGTASRFEHCSLASSSTSCLRTSTS